MFTKQDIKNYIKGYIKFQCIPFVAGGTIFTILKFLIKFGLYINDPNLFVFLESPTMITILVISSILYIFRFYKERWDLKYDNRPKLRYYHAITGIAVGLIASAIPYVLNLTTLFFFTVNFVFHGHSENALWQVSGYSFLLTLIINDLFRSMDGKSGYLFSMRKKGPVWLEKTINYFKKQYFD